MSEDRSNNREQLVYDAAQTWKERCLVADGSILSPNKAIWTSAVLNELDLDVFTENFDAHDGTFISKLKEQISELSPDCKQLISECLWLLLLFPSNITLEKKREHLREVWTTMDNKIDESVHELSDDVLLGIGNAGTAYNTHRWRELVLLIKITREAKKQDTDHRKSVFQDPWYFSKWIGNIATEPKRNLVHILPHLLFPDFFERIVSLTDKHKVLSHYKNMAIREIEKWSVPDIDKSLYALRKTIKNEHGSHFNFYQEDMVRHWRPKPNAKPKNSNSIQLENRRHSNNLPRTGEVTPTNLIIYGPPGTGKTRKLKEDHFPYYQDGAGDRFEFITFHQSYAYEDFVEGIRPETEDSTVKYEVRWGPLRRICDQARKAPDKRFALFIDEINRGNVAKIFGELITLVEADKRIRTDASGEKLSDCTGLEVTLPYSSDKFGVPVNVDVIGTMNTADRSIALLDSALRRRFEFEELAPQPELLDPIPDGNGGQIDQRKLLEAMNARLTHLLHRDQTLGHSYLMGLETFEDLRLVFEKKILPFLQEVFYDDWRQIRLVLADDSVEQEELQLIRTRAVTVGELFPGADLPEIGDSPVFEAAPANEITPDAIRKIYELSE